MSFLGTGGLGLEGDLGALTGLELVESDFGRLGIGGISEELVEPAVGRLGIGGISEGVKDATGGPSPLLGLESLCLGGCLGGGGRDTAGGWSSDCTLLIGGGGSALFDRDGRSEGFLFPA